MNAGTALQEQNGVATPNPAAATLAAPSRLPPSSRRVRSIERKLRRTRTTKMIATSSSRIFVVSTRKKCNASDQRDSGVSPRAP